MRLPHFALTLAQLTQAVNSRIVMSMFIVMKRQFECISLNTYCGK